MRDLAGCAGWRGLRILIAIFAATSLEGAGLVLLAPLLTILTQGGGGRLAASEHLVFARLGADTPDQRLLLVLGVYAGLIGLRAIVVIRRDAMVNLFQADFVEHHRLRLIAVLTSAGWERLARLQHASVTQAMTNDIARISSLANQVGQMLLSLATVGMACVAALIVLPSSIFIIAPLLAALVGGGLRAGRNAGVAGRATNASSHKLLHDMSQFLAALKLALAQDLTEPFVREQAQTIAALSRRQVAFARQQTATRVLNTTVSAAVGGAVVLVGFEGLHLPAAPLLAVAAVISRLMTPAATLQQSLQQLFYGLPSYEAFTRLCDALTAGDCKPSSPAVLTPYPPGPIALQGVSYVHCDGSGQARGGVVALDLALKAGEMVALSGESGAGKTTVADLLTGLIVPQTGRVTIGGETLTASRVAAWRRQVSYVPQDPFLTHDTFRRNLLAAAPDARETDVRQALRLSGADELLARLPEGFDTVVGERGLLLSGGERQRLALARALVRKPRLLILDEATNALDVAGEGAILKRLAEMADRPTVLIITHRPDAVCRCERVVNLQRSDRLPAMGLASG